MRRFLLIPVLAITLPLSAQTNLLRNSSVRVSSEEAAFPSSALTDGVLLRSSTWMSAKDGKSPHTAEFTLPFYARMDSIVIHTGILPEEMKPSEMGRNAGFWCAKNFRLQYWDDANWTEIAETDVTENRSERVVFRFSSPITSFRFRFYCTDGEPIRVREIEGFGTRDASLAAPVLKSDPVEVSADESLLKVRITPEVTGKSMKYVGYNQGYLVPGCNAGAWWEYSGVNVARIWADLGTYADARWMKDFGPVSCGKSFEEAKAKMRKDPESNVPWDMIEKKGIEVVPATNTMSYKYALETMKALGIEVLIQSGIPRSYYDASWEHKWELWQRFYCQAFWSAKTGGVEMYSLINEPNHKNAGPMPLDSWIEMAKVASDAAKCALEDVNRLYGTTLKARFVGPVTAGTNTNWWTRIAASQDPQYIDMFSTHSYNLPAAGYAGRVTMMRKLIRENNPSGKEIPVVYTETGRWMNAYLIDKAETMDSPSLFTEWAGMYVRNMLEGCYGMWAFKFGNTASPRYPRGIKSGHHYMWKESRFAEDAFENLALGAAVRTSDGKAPEKITDGNKSTAWTCETPGPKTVEVSFRHPVEIGGLVIYTGSEGGEFTAPDRSRSFLTELLTSDGWKKVGEEKICNYAQVYCTVEPAVRASAVRYTIRDDFPAKVREIKAFGPGTLSAAPRSYDVSGAHRAAEVVRLFAKGFKEERPLLKAERSFESSDIDMVASCDPSTGMRYIWAVNRRTRPVESRIDLSGLGVKDSDPIVVETVSGGSYGEASVAASDSKGILPLMLAPQSVNLVSIAPSGRKAVSVSASTCASVRGGGRKAVTRNPEIEMDSRTLDGNSVAYVSFNLPDVSGASRILLGIGAKAVGTDKYRFHVYGFDGLTPARGLKWSSAPHLSATESLATEVGAGVYVAGQIAARGESGMHWLDVTDLVRKHCSGAVTFELVRELREPGDDYDKGNKVIIESKPVLKIW